MLTGVKNLRSHLAQEAIDGILPTYIRILKVRSAMVMTMAFETAAVNTMHWKSFNLGLIAL
jgi:hypothetical protein